MVSNLFFSHESLPGSHHTLAEVVGSIEIRGWGGYSGYFWVGVCHLDFDTLTLYYM